MATTGTETAAAVLLEIVIAHRPSLRKKIEKSTGYKEIIDLYRELKRELDSNIAR